MSSKKYIPSPGGILPNGTVYEQIQVGHSVQYAIKTSKGISIEPFIEVGEHIVYQPLSPSPWMLPPEPIPYESLQDLWDELKEFVWQHLDIENKKLYEVYVAWILVSWIPEKFDSVGYLHFHGSRNTGKTRALDILNFICFRPLESPSASGATIFRAMDAYHPTFLLDEFEMYEKMKESKAEVIGIINAGYRRGQVVLRMTGMKEGMPTIKGFRVFGPKALSSIEELPDALSSRCIRFPMTRTFRKIRRLMDKHKASELRGKLLHWRFSHDLEEPMTEDNPIDLPDGRLIEMFYPLESVAPSKEIKKTILQCAMGQYNSSIQEIRATREAQVFHTIMKLSKNYPRLEIPQKEIREAHGMDYLGGQPMAYQTLGGIMKRMGFESRFDNKLRATVMMVEIDKIERRKNNYVLAEEMKDVDATIRRLRVLEGGQQVFTTESTVSTESTAMGTPSETVDQLQEDNNATQETVETVKTVDSVVSVDSVDSVFAVPTLQERLEIVLATLRNQEKPITEYTLGNILKWNREELNKVIKILDQEGRVGQPRPGYWVAS